MRLACTVLAGVSLLALGACNGGGDAVPPTAAALEPPPAEPLALTQPPPAQAALEPMSLYLAGLQRLADDAHHQNEVHRYCTQTTTDFAQCVVFDANSRDAHLTGVEYVISAETFEALPADEKRYWHPRQPEVESGRLLAPQLALDAEKLAMQNQLRTYVKAWHLWDTERGTAPPQALPMGPARLARSFERDDEVQPGLLRGFEETTRVDLVEKRRERATLQADDDTAATGGTPAAETESIQERSP